MSSSSLSFHINYQQRQSFLSSNMPSTLLLLFLLATAFGYVPNLLHPHDSALIKLNNYDSTVRPPGENRLDGPVEVSVNMYIRSVESIDHFKNEIKLQLTFREKWVDSRLAFKNNNQDVSTNEVQLFWKPDVFFSNEKSGHFHTLTAPNTFARLYENGSIFISSRISLTLDCPMQLWSFPMDTQQCNLRMASYGYTEQDMTLYWKGIDPVQVSNSLAIPGYTYTGFNTDTCSSVTNTGLYIPLVLLVIASWTSFWLPASAASPRLAVGSVTTLAAALLIFRQDEFLRLPSLTSLDVWVGVSALFIFAAFIEFVVVTYFAGQSDPVTQDDAEASKRRKPEKILCFTLPEGITPTDAVAKISFPVAYVLFHVAFGPFLF